MKVLITGITGMIGSTFSSYLKMAGHEVYGIARPSALARQKVFEDEHFRFCDILDKQSLATVFERWRPEIEIVIHLAAQAFNSISWEMEHVTLLNNIGGTLNVLQCCREFCPNAKLLVACSSTEYGEVPIEETPIKEERLLRPVSPYGVSKVAAECLGYQYFSNYGLKVFLPRLFIHVGPGHPPATAIQNFARQLALIRKGLCPPIVKVGRLDTARDFIDARDGVKAMMLLLEKGRPGEPYNICTGEAHTVQWVLDSLIRISDLNVEIVEDHCLMRPSDEALLLGDSSKITALGWKPDFTLEQTLTDIYNDWLARV